MLSSRWPTQNEVNKLTGPLCIYKALVLCFYGIPVCAKCVAYVIIIP